MELVDAVRGRRSVRGYLDKPVDRKTLEEVLKLAQRAVSALNTQPWKFAVVTGDILDRIREENIACFRAGEAPDYGDQKTEGIYMARRIGIAKQLFVAMDITRGDREKRDRWTERGYRFFEAPAAILIYMDGDLDETKNRFEMGAVAQLITLAAMEYGLGTCVENQAIMYEKGIRKYLDLPEEARLAAGIAIGYPDPDFPANGVVSERAELNDVTAWYGFGDD